jgi:hypothetical protein
MMQDRRKTCRVCGARFAPTGNNQRYCPGLCRDKGRRRQQQRYYEEHSSAIIAGVQRRYRARRQKGGA